MVAWLVVTLPAAFTGGSLVAEHRGATATYRSLKQALSFVAFFVDCHHEIRPVRSGHWIVLSYNLLLHGAEADASAEVRPAVVETIATSLGEHFATTPSAVFGRTDDDNAIGERRELHHIQSLAPPVFIAPLWPTGRDSMRGCRGGGA